jgi:hypothetical protein
MEKKWLENNYLDLIFDFEMFIMTKYHVNAWIINAQKNEWSPIDKVTINVIL